MCGPSRGTSGRASGAARTWARSRARRAGRSPWTPPSPGRGPGGAAGEGTGRRPRLLLPIDTGLEGLPAVSLDADEVAGLRPWPARSPGRRRARRGGARPVLGAARRARRHRPRRDGRLAPDKVLGRAVTTLISGVEGLRPELGRLFVTIGVFDGLHRGHAYLLGHLVAEAAGWAPGRRSSPSTITPMRCSSARLHRSCSTRTNGSSVWRRPASGSPSSSTFDEAVRETPYEAFVRAHRGPGRARRISHDAGQRVRVPAAGDAGGRGGPRGAAGLRGRRRAAAHRAGSPAQLIRDPATDREGDLAGAAELLGRPYAVVGKVGDDGEVGFPMPVALPPPGRYAVGESTVLIGAGSVRLVGSSEPGVRRLTLA